MLASPKRMVKKAIVGTAAAMFFIKIKDEPQAAVTKIAIIIAVRLLICISFLQNGFSHTDAVHRRTHNTAGISGALACRV